MEKERCLRELALPLLGKWSIFIVLILAEEEMYFAQLEREIGIISRKMLSQKLNDLIEIHIVYKKGESSTGQKTYYGLTPLGKSLLAHIYGLKNWMIENEEFLRKK